MSTPSETGLGKLSEHEAAKRQSAELERLKSGPKYTVASAADIFRKNAAEPKEIWGGIRLTNDINEIIGASGIGKSRITLYLAVLQCLADTWPADTPVMFAGHPVCRDKLKWLFIGSENGEYRYHYDLSRMLQGCTEEQISQLGERLFLPTLEGDGDSYIALDNEENIAKYRAVIAEVQPDVLVLDPWGDVCGGSELDDSVVRETVATIRSLRKGLKDTMAIIIVNHSRMGLAENAKARGLDAANFGKNSKVLYTISRSVWNLAYLEDDAASKVVAVIHAKHSNGTLYEKHAVRLDDERMRYVTIENIDVDQRLRDLASVANKPMQNRTETLAAGYDAMLRTSLEKLRGIFDKGKLTKDQLEVAIKRIGVPVRDVKSVISELETSMGVESQSSAGRGGKLYYGTREQIAAYREELAAEEARRMAEEAAAKAKKDAEKAEKMAGRETGVNVQKPRKRGRKPKK